MVGKFFVTHYEYCVLISCIHLFTSSTLVQTRHMISCKWSHTIPTRILHVHSCWIHLTLVVVGPSRQVSHEDLEFLSTYCGDGNMIAPCSFDDILSVLFRILSLKLKHGMNLHLRASTKKILLMLSLLCHSMNNVIGLQWTKGPWESCKLTNSHKTMCVIR